MTIAVTLDAVLTGKARRLARGFTSAIDKQPITGRMAVEIDGLNADEQADRRHHGGPEMALLFYPADHYPAWRSELPEKADRFVAGGFGENLSANGLSEENVLIGDIWRAGTTLLQVAQGRAPCRTLNRRFEDDGMVSRVSENGRAGWYLRVLETGTIGAGDTMTLVDRADHGWTVRRTADVILHKAGDAADLRALAALETLAPEWREKATKARR